MNYADYAYAVGRVIEDDYNWGVVNLEELEKGLTDVLGVSPDKTIADQYSQEDLIELWEKGEIEHCFSEYAFLRYTKQEEMVAQRLSERVQNYGSDVNIIQDFIEGSSEELREVNIFGLILSWLARGIIKNLESAQFVHDGEELRVPPSEENQFTGVDYVNFHHDFFRFSFQVVEARLKEILERSGERIVFENDSGTLYAGGRDLGFVKQGSQSYLFLRYLSLNRGKYCPYKNIYQYINQRIGDKPHEKEPHAFCQDLKSYIKKSIPDFDSCLVVDSNKKAYKLREYFRE